MAANRKLGLCIVSFSLGIVALPTGIVALVHRGSFVGVVLILAGMALLAQGLELSKE